MYGTRKCHLIQTTMKRIIKFILLTFLFLVQITLADEVYLTAGFSHLSALQTGPPANDKPEMAYDAPFIGIEYHKTSWDMVFETRVSHIIQDDEIDGSNPRISFEVKKRFRIFQK